MYRQFNIQQFYVLPTQCIYVFCVDLRTYLPLFPYTALTGFCNRDGECLLRGTDLIFMCNSAYCHSAILSSFYQLYISKFLLYNQSNPPPLPPPSPILLSPNTTSPNKSLISTHIDSSNPKIFTEGHCFFIYTTAQQKKFSEITPVWKWRK